MQTVTFNKQAITPSKIVCIGRNYLAHIQELGNAVPDELVVFLKPNSAITEKLNRHHLGEVLHYEAELAYLYQGGRFSAVALGLDLTKRGLQSQLKSKGLPWEKAKAFNGSALFSEFMPIEDNDIPLTLSLTIDGELKQHASNQLMMHKPSDILAQLSSWLTLEDGDIVMTGTPQGVGEVTQNSDFVGGVWLQQEKLVEVKWRS
ncbi:fumarylacetoacetate hydrolase family protein [Thalassotalea sp. LPB0316]|uniref:fumarylacetoacetate hydrolase family protein n=1 Tax=Thalassotalea sp. LPB0316 TaxID=2769490 RepID=UPI001867BA3D|nr:fumarylacetoacetate hydrolase family protein [Thalassotalea sp. LPB0316]QOL26767.1 fumarylacetoacetate hydrolase family protein [Thalassotalea sp. LPB0316]